MNAALPRPNSPPKSPNADDIIRQARQSEAWQVPNSAPKPAPRPAVKGETDIVSQLRSGNLDGFLTAFENAAGPAALAAWRTLSKGDASLLAVVCRNAGLSRAAFSAMVVLSNPGRDADETEKFLAAFEREKSQVTAA